MELYWVMSIVDRGQAEKMLTIYDKLQFPLVLANLGVGTATSEHLLLYDLQQSEKAVFSTVATRESVKKLFIYAENEMYIDVPGNGIMLSVPLKSVDSKETLEQLLKGQQNGGGTPSMEFKHELIIVIFNEGFADDVMDAARAAGAGGGTVLHAKGTGGEDSQKFMGVSLAKNKEMIYIVANSEQKAAIMQSISKACGKDTEANAMSFTVPVSAVTGIREITEDFFEKE